MTVDIDLWKKNVVDEVKTIADEEFQRTAWFGIGPWVASPDEQFCAFFDNASVPEFLAYPNNGLSGQQKLKLTYLNNLMRRLSDDTLGFIKPEDLIDDPRWIEIRNQAAITLKALSSEA